MPEVISFVAWLEAYFYLGLGSTSSGLMTLYPHQRGPAFALGNPDIQLVGIAKAAQQGFTKIIAAYCAYAIIVWRFNVICYHPSPDASDKFSDGDIRQMLEDSPEIGKHLMVDDPNKRDPKNKNRKRVFKTGILHTLPGNTGGWYRGFTGDLILGDDFDGFPKQLRGQSKENEGSPRFKMPGRANSSPRMQLGFISTYTTPNGAINELKYSVPPEARMRRQVRCPYEDCDQWQYLEFNPLIDMHLSERERKDNPPMHGLMYDVNATTRQEKLDSVHYVCRHCKKKFDETSYTWLNQNGRYYSEKFIQRDSDGEFTDHDGNLVKPPKQIFYDVDGLFTNTRTWTDLVEHYLIALEEFDRTGDMTPLIGVINEVFAKVFFKPEPSQFSQNELIGRLERYPHPIPKGVLKITMGVDIGDTYYRWTIVGIGAGLERWVLACGHVIGRPGEGLDRCEGGRELTALSEQVFQTEDKRNLPIEIVCIDALYYPDQIKRWCSKKPRQRFACQGQPRMPLHPVIKVNKPAKGDISCIVIKVGVHRVSGIVYSQLSTPQPEKYKWGMPAAGYVHFPKAEGFYEVDEDGVISSDYFSELTAEKEGEDANGHRIYYCPDGMANERHDEYKLAAVVAVEIIEHVFKNKFPEIEEAEVA